MPPIIFVALWALAAAALVWLSIAFADGHLVYTIDDPYIHLAMAENIVRGVYGVNLGEFSSPSSSVIYPFILALTEMLGLGMAGPLVVNLAAAGLSVWLLLDHFWSRAVPRDGNTYVFALALSPLLVFLINALALPMTGMEHALHVLAVVLVMRGLILAAETGRVGPSLAIAIVLTPFVRFEGLALSGAALLGLALLRRWRLALLLGLLLGLLLAAYAGFVHSLDLPVLPSSVMVKSDIVANLARSRGLLKAVNDVADNLFKSVENRSGLVLALAICALMMVARRGDDTRRRLRSPEAVVAIVAGLALAAHLLAGLYGWFWRYEVYAFAIAAVAGIYVFRAELAALQSQRLYVAQFALLLATVTVATPYIYAAYLTPAASRGVYEQHHQMHRFATELFPRSVAVNDIGRVSYRNDSYVLDLFGLGSETVRRLKAARRFDAAAIERLARERSVDYAMIYAHRFWGRIPASWCPVAVLESEKVSAASGEVWFYLTRPEALEDLRRALARFRATLPGRVALRDMQCDRP
ncbi:MAG: hypothetical protein QF893_09630 [Alphaproteobacteria bacterium]|nr:hypothetical protein [Alphaproteobacteria bacterium]